MQPSKNLLRGPRIGAAVKYSVSVLNADGSLARRLPRKRNLILDAGLDLVAVNYWADLFSYAAVGTGTDPVRRDSGAVTLTRAGNVVTASAGFFEAGDVGRLIKWDSGEEAYVSAFTSPTEVETADSGAIAADAGTVWYVNRTGLAAESKRTNTYGTDSGDNGSTYSLGAWVFKRTFIFSAESGAVTYGEIGWSPHGAPGANLFGMDIISGGVSLSVGQQLKVVVELSLALEPAASTPWSNVITGWSQDGDACVESAYLGRAVSFVDAGGTTNRGYANSGGLFDANTNKTVTLCNDSTPLIAQTTTPINLVGELANKGLVGQTYASGSFTRSFVGVFAVGEGNSPSIRSLVFRTAEGNKTYRVLLDAAETKDSDHTLALTFRLSWGRVLTN